LTGNNYPFGECARPIVGSRYCLLADHRANGSEPSDHVLAVGISETAKHLSSVFGYPIDEPADFVDEMSEDDLRALARRHHAEAGKITIYMCDIGSGGGIETVHAESQEVLLG